LVLFARTNTFVNRLLFCFCPRKLKVQQLPKALLLVGRKPWKLLNNFLEAHFWFLTHLSAKASTTTDHPYGFQKEGLDDRPGLSLSLTSHHLEQFVCRKLACTPPAQSLNQRASSAGGFCGLPQSQLPAISGRDELYFGIRQQTEALPQFLRNGMGTPRNSTPA
jgi:hypothetical protein